MYELTPSQFSLSCPLFENTHYGVLAAGTLEGGHPGRVFVDDPVAPSSALICSRVGYYFLGGKPDVAPFNRWLFETFSCQLAPDQFYALSDPQVLLFYPNEAWKAPLFDTFAGCAPIAIHKKRMVLCPDVITRGWQAFRCWREQLPPNFVVARMTSAFFNEHPELAAEAILFWGSEENFEHKSLGYCLIDQNTGLAASACSAVFVGGGEAEITIFTAPDYRRRGLARLAASAFIEGAIKRSLRPVWGTFPENTASIALARSLGFCDDIDQPICFWEWRK